MDIGKLSHGLGTYSDEGITKSNVVPIRSSKAESSPRLTPTSEPSDRVTLNSLGTEPDDGIRDTVTLSGAAQVASTASTREARVAGVIAAVQNGSYQVDSKAVANAVLSKMLDKPDLASTKD